MFKRQYLFVARNKLDQVKVSDVDLPAEFHTTATTPVTQQITETVPQYLHHNGSSVAQ